MKTVYPQEIPTAEFHGLLLGTIAPRPIAFVSTIDQNGNVNLSPYSFFNAFSVNPPVLIFSPARRVRDNTIKHTLENAQKTRELVVNIVNHDMVEQMSLASTEYDKGVNEFIKAGLTEASSEKVKPPRVAESPASFECKVREVVELGNHGGAGNLVICEVLVAHFQDHIFNENDQIDPFKLDLVARAGGNWYCRVNEHNLFEIEKPVRTKGIGIDQLPHSIRESNILTGNNLAQLANIEKLPTLEDLIEIKLENLEMEVHQQAQFYLNQRQTDSVQKAWKVLLNSL